MHGKPKAAPTLSWGCVPGARRCRPRLPKARRGWRAAGRALNSDHLHSRAATHTRNPSGRPGSRLSVTFARSFVLALRFATPGANASSRISTYDELGILRAAWREGGSRPVWVTSAGVQGECPPQSIVPGQFRRMSMMTKHHM